ncbi:MAG: Ig-like domain-containing protein [Patescibacteria group bacterium]
MKTVCGLLLLAIILIPASVYSESTVLSVTVVALPQCQDGIDNDGDTLIDYPLDLECDTAIDTTESVAPPPTSSGGGGGGGSSNSNTQVAFRGKGYPGSTVTILKDARIAASTTASPDGGFDVTIKGLAAGTYTFSVYGTDSRGVQSATHTFTVSLTNGVTNIITGIFLPPTISLNKKEVKYGDVIQVLGQTTPYAEVTIFVNSAHEVVKKLQADAQGAWLLNFDTTEIERGNHSTQSRAAKAGEISPLSRALEFKVGAQNIFAEDVRTGCTTSDANCDGRVNLVDYSILVYWFKRSNPPVSADLNGDGAVTIIDFSIMAYNWNG